MNTEHPMSHEQPHPTATQREFLFHRTLDASRSTVFQAWVNPHQLAQWWGPEGFTNPVCTLDVRPGGLIRVDMRSPDEVIYPMGGAYREISEPSRLVFTSTALDAHGVPELEALNTLTLTETDGETELRLEARIIHATTVGEQYLNGMNEGWAESLDRLAAFLRTF
jgi:uncharacterized protein YndB with AHSA1/START domain